MNSIKIFLVLFFSIIFFFIVPIFYVSNAHNAYLIERQFKYLQALTTIRCNDGAPFFLKKILIKSIYMDALSNQIAYTKNNQTYLCVSGWFDEENTMYIDDNHILKYASLTKLFTADLILNLVNKNELGLDDPFTLYLKIQEPLQDQKIKKITIRDLLQHSAGFDRQKTGDYIFSQKQWCDDDLESHLTKMELQFGVRQKNIYSNEGYCILGKILERKYDLKFHEILKQEYPDLTLYSVINEAQKTEVYYNYEFTDYKMEYLQRLYLNNLIASADLIGSAKSINLAMNRMIQRKPYNIMSLDQMLKCNIAQYKSCYGLAMSPIRYEKGTLLNRDGVIPGATSYSFITEKKNVFVMLTNSMPFNPQESTVKFKNYIANLILDNEN